MKQSNIYYKTLFKRKTVGSEVALLVFIFLMSWPRLLLELFLRKNFGERYFSMVSAIFVAFFMFWIPVMLDKFMGLYGGYGTTILEIIFRNITWYLFLAAFLYFSWQRQKEITREPGTYDFAKFSLSTGIVDQRFYNLKIFGEKARSERDVSIFHEPVFCFLIGLAFAVFFQKVGFLIMFSSLCYSTTYRGDYIRGDHFVLDTIDEMICNEELVNTFVHGHPKNEARGFEPYGRRPADPDMRQKVADAFTEDIEFEEVK